VCLLMVNVQMALAHRSAGDLCFCWQACTINLGDFQGFSKGNVLLFH
jgi:hypothetical protein